MAETMESKIIYPAPGKYVVAVSGGVDSMSLLDILVKRSEYELIVANFYHGIRDDSHLDMELVHDVAATYNLEFAGGRLDMGGGASEGDARKARYEFLYRIMKEQGAEAIATAHHLDDRIETMLLNKQRGAGWYGLAPLRETDTIKRPLLEVWKLEIVEYAQVNELKWREDSTNKKMDTPRNHIRQQLAAEPGRKRQLAHELKVNDEYRDRRMIELEDLAKDIVESDDEGCSIKRSSFLALDTTSAQDMLFYVLHSGFGHGFARDQIKRLEHFVKTGLVGKEFSLGQDLRIVSQSSSARITRLGRGD